MTTTASRPPTREAGANRPPARPPIRLPADVRRTLLALLASALGAFPLFELFSDSGWIVDVWLTMIVVIAPAAWLRRTRHPSAAQIWIGVVLLVPWLTLNFLREHALFGIIPLHAAWHDLGSRLTSLHRTTTESVAPIHTTIAVRLAVCALLGLVAALVDLLAVVGRHGALAGVPLLVVFTVSGAVPRHPVGWLWFALAAAGFLILLALDSSDDLQRWGHVVPRSAKTRRRASVFSGQRIAAVAIVLALAVPVFIPSDSRNLLADLFHPGGNNGEDGFGQDLNAGAGTGGIDPFAALHGALVRDRSVDLLKVKISSPDGTVGVLGGVQPFYLRTNVLSTFQGDGWRPGSDGPRESVTDTQFASSPGTAFQPRTANFTAQMTVSGLRSNPPVFASPTAIQGLSARTSWSPQNMLLIDSKVDGGQQITEQVAQPEPTAAELRAATAAPDPAMQQWLRLPAIAPFVHDLTARIIARASTPYDRARAISTYFADQRNGFSYSLTAASGDSGDQLTDFLKHKQGYCQQYAASMGVMLRLAGIPSRVVLGYAHEVPTADNEFTVTTFDAHAWVEGYFEGVGWVPFDPTPLTGISGGAANDLPWAPHARVDNGRSNIAPSREPTIPKRASSTAPARRAAPAAADQGISLAIPLTVLAVLIVAAAIALVPAWVRWRRRRARVHRIRHGDTDALWAELSDTAVDLGYVWSDARTPRQVARWLGNSSDAASTTLQTLTTAVEHARYRPHSSPGADLTAELAAVRDGLGARRSPRERMRARFWPASLDWSHVRWVGRWLPGATGPRRH
jgi:hypothetical protein